MTLFPSSLLTRLFHDFLINKDISVQSDDVFASCDDNSYEENEIRIQKRYAISTIKQKMIELRIGKSIIEKFA